MARIVPIRLGFVKAFLLQEQGNILVDTGSPGSASAICRALARVGLRPTDLSLILITHGHTDHFGSAAELQAESGAPLAVARADADPLRQGSNRPAQPLGAWGLPMKLGLRLGGGAPPCRPNLLLEGEASLALYGVEATVLPTPGHTAGALSLLLPDGQAIVGDLVMGGLMGRGRPGAPLVCEDLDAHRASLRRLLELGLSLWHTSHGGPFPLDEVKGRLSAIEAR
ncbi:MAG: MBL fold metallo-hydrolase [Chloroflexi bacterium]|nr:MBL fold metallo-hydrolase [Chloroflexota bacterium]